MKRTIIGILIAGLIGGVVVGYKYLESTNTGAPPYAEADLDAPEVNEMDWLRNWKRPAGPARVGLQVGHWQNSEMPEELERLEGNTGTSGGGMWEWEVNLTIANKTKEMLEKYGVVVDIIPATVPPGYIADVFLAIHADGSVDRSKRGFKFAYPRRDYTGKASKLVDTLRAAYQKKTGFEEDPNVTRNMRGYYAFAWWRYEHAVHPMTVSAIAETGFLTSAADQRILVRAPEISAEGLANGLVQYLTEEGLI